MSAIEEKGDEDKYIVDEAKHYVESLKNSGRLWNYLQHNRKILKAEFSSCISITNPDRSTSLFNTLFMSCDWENRESIKRHFGILNQLLS